MPPQRDIRRAMQDTLERSLTYLLQEPRRTGNWTDVRGTADSLIAMHNCLEERSLPGLRRYAANWLVSRMDSDGDEVGNWEEEVWDTAIATVGLAREREHRAVVQKAVAWLAGAYQQAHGNWNDEPWETLWALLAVHAAVTYAGVPEPNIDLARPLKWLMGLRGNSTPGLLINWHYTAMFFLVANRYANRPLSSDVDDALRTALREAGRESVSCLVEELAKPRAGDELWTDEIWSNSLAAWALAESDALRLDLPGLDRLSAWFSANLDNQAEVFTEDRAFACIALANLLSGIRRAEEMAFARRLESLAPTDSHPDLQEVLSRCSVIVASQRKSDLKAEMSRRLAKLRDYTPRAPLLAHDVFQGYYSVNLRALPTKIFLIVAATAALTVISRNAADVLGDQAAQVVVWIPLGLGVLATLAQLTNFTLVSIFPRRRSPTDQND